MVGQKHFHYEVGYDDQGLTVAVTHKPTGQRRMARPERGESVPALQMRLVHQLLAGLVNETDSFFHVGRCVIDGHVERWYQVEHVPTKRKKSLDTLTSPDVKQPREWLLDLLVEELWEEGVLPKPE